tara:strand:- start:2544 stop:2660 length:117 start_codon:yes stop_codon:yes gene_type:complete
MLDEKQWEKDVIASTACVKYAATAVFSNMTIQLAGNSS